MERQAFGPNKEALSLDYFSKRIESILKDSEIMLNDLFRFLDADDNGKLLLLVEKQVYLDQLADWKFDGFLKHNGFRKFFIDFVYCLKQSDQNIEDLLTECYFAQSDKELSETLNSVLEKYNNLIERARKELYERRMTDMEILPDYFVSRLVLLIKRKVLNTKHSNYKYFSGRFRVIQNKLFSLANYFRVSGFERGKNLDA